MALTSTCGGYNLGQGCVAADMDTAFVGGSAWGDFATVMNQDHALKIPLGSQLNLLNAREAGNIYLNMMSTSMPRYNSAEMPLTYNSFSAGGPMGGFYSLGSGYVAR